MNKNILTGLVVLTAVTTALTAFNVSPAHAQSVPAVYCSPLLQTVQSGQTANFSASGGNGVYTWRATGANNPMGFSKNFSTSYTVPTNSDTTFTVTVESGGSEIKKANCLVRVLGAISPMPTTSATPTPSVTPSAANASQLDVRLTGKNITRGQNVAETALAVFANDTLEFTVRIRSLAGSNTTLGNVTVTDLLPAGLNYISRSTSVNGTLAADGIIGSGLNIGSLAPGQEAVVKLNARVHAGSVFPSGTSSVVNTVQVRSSASASSATVHMTVSYGQVLGASIGKVAGVNTGPADSIIISLLAACLATYGYIQYAGTPTFRRRDARSIVRRHAGKGSDRLNFNRFD